MNAYCSVKKVCCMQVNARMGGGPVYAMNNFVWGIDLVEEQFLGSCGIPSRPYMAKKPVKCIAEFSVNAQKTGKLLNVDWVDVRPSLQSLIGQGALSESYVTQACCKF